jgi:hypothetical protein
MTCLAGSADATPGHEDHHTGPVGWLERMGVWLLEGSGRALTVEFWSVSSGALVGLVWRAP